MFARIFLGMVFSVCVINLARSEEIIVFGRDVQPILESRCLECHGPDEAKNDFRVDDAISMGDYVEPGDLESSMLWTDYIITEDPDMKMPPLTSKQHQGFGAAEIAVLKTWIEEGAKHEWKKATQVEEPESKAEAKLSDTYKWYMLQGLFHPAMTHFPVALLSISTLFLILSFFCGESFEKAAFHCLWVGALGAIAACITGWGYAAHEGYAVGFSIDKPIDRHRWLGMIVMAGSLVLLPIAYSVFKNPGSSKKIFWLIGALLIGAGVSLVGYQGGELTYGEDHYAKEYEHLFPSTEEAAPAASTEQPKSEEKKPEGESE